MGIRKNNVQNAEVLDSKVESSKVLDIKIEVDNYRQYNTAMNDGVNSKDVKMIESIYKEYEKSIKESIANRVLKIIPSETLDCIDELRRLENEVNKTKEILKEKNIKKYNTGLEYERNIIEAEIMIVKDELTSKKLELSKFIAKNKDLKVSLDLVKLQNELRDNVQEMVDEIDDTIIILRTQMNMLRLLRRLVYDSKYIVEEEVSKRFNEGLDREFMNSVENEIPLVIIMSDKKAIL